MTGVSITFDDRPAVWREVPAVPRADETLIYEGYRYRVRAVVRYVTDMTWSATIACERFVGKGVTRRRARDLAREELARQLWFWRGRDAELAEHVKTFTGSTHTEQDWMDLLIQEERDMWLDRADRVLVLLSEQTAVVDRICFLIGQTHDTTELWTHMKNDPDAFRDAVRMGLKS